MEAITSFTGEHRFLSNFWPAGVMLDGLRFRTVEHAYQAAKTLDHHDRLIVQHFDTPGTAKRFGRRLELRVDWENVKLSVMEDLVRQKFTLSHLARLLIATDPRELIEGNTWGDQFWGVCRGQGENHLGKILMRVRAELMRSA